MTALPVLRPEITSWRTRLERLLRRGRLVLDESTLARSGRIVAKIRRRGDETLLNYANRLDDSEEVQETKKRSHYVLQMDSDERYKRITPQHQNNNNRPGGRASYPSTVVM